eukprot:10782_5
MFQAAWTRLASLSSTEFLRTLFPLFWSITSRRQNYCPHWNHATACLEAKDNAFTKFFTHAIDGVFSQRLAFTSGNKIKLV